MDDIMRKKILSIPGTLLNHISKSPYSVANVDNTGKLVLLKHDMINGPHPY